MVLALASAAFAQLRPDPLVQALDDGCERFNSGLYTRQAPNWAYINDKDYSASGDPPPPQWVKGTADVKELAFLASHPAGGDNPFTHFRHDFLVNVRPDPQYAWLLGGDPERRTGNFESRGEGTERLHTEWEESAWAPFARPEPGDRVELLGSWVWDCDHFAPVGEQTELHPIRAVWVARTPGRPSPRSPYGETEGDLLISTDKTQAGTQAGCAHRAKGDDAIFQACLAADDGWQDVNGSYRFELVAPEPRPRGARLYARVLDRGSTPGIIVRVRLPVGAVRYSQRRAKSVAEVSVDVNAPRGRRVVVAKQVFLGWRPRPARTLPVHLQVSFKSLLVRRAMDPGCPGTNRACTTPQTTLREQNSKPPGEWNVYWSVAGIWSLWDPPLLRARDGQRFRGRQSVDFFVAAGRPWRLYLFARECDFAVSVRGDVPMAPCPGKTGEFGAGEGDETAGHVVRRFRSPAGSLGTHTLNATTRASTCPPVNRRGCYAVTVEVRRIHDEARRARALARRP